MLTFDFGDLGEVIDRIEQFRSMVSKYRDQSAKGVSGKVLQATFRAGMQDESMRDHLALHATASTRLGGSCLVPMEPSKEKARQRMPPRA